MKKYKYAKDDSFLGITIVEINETKLSCAFPGCSDLGWNGGFCRLHQPPIIIETTICSRCGEEYDAMEKECPSCGLARIGRHGHLKGDTNER
mgnify:CR=1 FL=1